MMDQNERDEAIAQTQRNLESLGLSKKEASKLIEETLAADALRAEGQKPPLSGKDARRQRRTDERASSKLARQIERAR